jgi:hypothetical protein
MTSNIISSGSAIEDTVNELILQGTGRSYILGELLRGVRRLMGNPATQIIDEDGTGEVTGIVMGTPMLIEHVAELCASEEWAVTDIAPPDSETGIMGTTNGGKTNEYYQ